MHIAFHHVDIQLRTLAPFCTMLGDFGFHTVTHDASEAWLRTPNAYLHLVQSDILPAPQHDFTCAGISHLCIQTADMRQALTILHRHGAQPLSDPVNLGTGHWYLYARTPGGDIIEIEGVPYAPPTEPSPWLAHVALVSGDVVRLADFYQQLTGTTRRGGHPIGPNPRFDEVLQQPAARMIPIWLVGLNVTIELWQFLNPTTQQTTTAAYGYRALAMTVDDVTDWCAQAVRLGAQCHTQTDTHALLSDPDGNVLQITHTDAALPPLHTCPDLAVIARINALWRPFDATISWESTL
jgi:hypothetical protein